MAGLEYFPQVFPCSGSRRKINFRQLRVAQDGCEDVVEIMGASTKERMP